MNAFNGERELPYSLRLQDFQMAMQDVYDFLFDVDSHLVARSLRRFEAMLRPAILSGILSDLLTSNLARHSRSLTENTYFNGHPDLVVEGMYPGDAVKAGEEGVEVKCTRKRGGAVDTHGARAQWMCVFVYAVDSERGTRWAIWLEWRSRTSARTKGENSGPVLQRSTGTG